MPSIDFVNMQTYAGVRGLEPNDFEKIGFKPKQLLYGACPETNCGGSSLETVESKYTKNKLASVHTYRLNSDNYIEEDAAQAKIYHFLHPNNTVNAC